MDYIKATRPWSFTAAMIPVLVVAAVTHTPYTEPGVWRCMAIAVSVQAGANLTNTYFDFTNGIDKKGSTGDPTLIDNKVSKQSVMLMSWFFYTIAFVLTYPFIAKSGESTHGLKGIFAAGCLSAYFYTANPIGLKYKALGDITIFLCFGPLLMQFVSILLTGEQRNDLYIYSIPIGLYTEAILHANNARDIKADKRAGATTLATLIGDSLSYDFYVILLVASYAFVCLIAYLYHYGCLANLLTAPMSYGLITQYKEGKMQGLPEETAKIHLLFGISLFLGIASTSSGIETKFF